MVSYRRSIWRTLSISLTKGDIQVEKYLNVVLVKIDEDRVIVINGEEYLVVDKDEIKETAVNQKNRSWPKSGDPTKDIQESILDVLDSNPDMKSKEIRQDLEKFYQLKLDPQALRGIMTRMKNEGLIVVRGLRNSATWSIK